MTGRPTFHDSQATKVRDSERKYYKCAISRNRNRHYCPACSFSSLDEAEYKVHYKETHVKKENK